MKRRWMGIAAALGLGLAAIRALSGQDAVPDSPRPEADRAPVPAERVPYDPQATSKTIAFWEGRARGDPQAATARRALPAASPARQRETGAIEDAVRAERAARESLKILPRGNAGGHRVLARSLLTQHRFPEALEAADRAAATDPEAQR